MINYIEALFKIGFPLSTIMLIALAYIFITNPEKIFLWSSKISELVSNSLGFFEKNAVANNIRGTVLSVSKELNKELADIAPYDLKIEWVKEANREAFIQDNQIVVRMRHHSSQSQNVVVALQSFVEKGIMPKAKRYIDNKVTKSTELAIVRNVLASKFAGCLDYFDDEVLDPILANDAELKDVFIKIVRLDESGMLTQVILREFLLLGQKLYPRASDDNIKKQTQAFIHYLYKVATKEQGENVPLCFSEGNIKVGVVIIARQDTYGAFGLVPYMDRIRHNLDCGLDTIYLISPVIYKSDIRTMLNTLNDSRIKEQREFSYYYMQGQRKIQSCCVALYTSPRVLTSVG